MIKLVSTCLGIGYLPFCPGTWASFAALGLYLVLKGNLAVSLFLSLIILVLGFVVTTKAEERFKRKDPPWVVIDEFSAVLLLLCFVPQDLKWLVASVLAFRLFDILKPYPIKKIEVLKKGFGIMLDDLAAGFYTVIFIWFVKVIILQKLG